MIFECAWTLWITLFIPVEGPMVTGGGDGGGCGGGGGR